MQFLLYHKRYRILYPQELLKKVVTFWTYHDARERTEYFVRAAAMVLKRTRNVRFVMAGKWHMMDQMIRLVAESGGLWTVSTSFRDLQEKENKYTRY